MKEFYVGIDMAKEKFDVCVLKENTVEPLGFAVFENETNGFKSMLIWIKSLKIKLKNCLFGLEHTGVYSLPLATFLQRKKLNYCLESGLQIAQSSGVKRAKSDKLDAQLIAIYFYRHRDQLQAYTLPNDLLREMKVLFSYRRRLVKMKVALQTASGEIIQFTDNAIVSTMASSAQSILSSIKQEIKMIEKQLLQLIERDKAMQENYDLVRSVPGVGPKTAMAFLIVTGNFNLFKNARKFACFVGVAPFAKQSGKSVYRKPKVSKIADKQMKSMLSMCTGAAIRTDPQTKQYYQKKRQEGKPEGIVRNAIMNKIIHRVFAVVNRGTAFVPLAQHAKA